MAANRGLYTAFVPHSIVNDTVILGTTRAYIAACNANTTFSGYGNSTGGSQLVKAINAATAIALSNLDIESISNITTVVPTTALTNAVNMVVALITEINTAIT
jgi:hypothetical protein